MKWRVTILSKDGQRLLHHAALDDLKEVQGYCTEARHLRADVQIWIKPPAGPVFPWD